MLGPVYRLFVGLPFELFVCTPNVKQPQNLKQIANKRERESKTDLCLYVASKVVLGAGAGGLVSAAQAAKRGVRARAIG